MEAINDIIVRGMDWALGWLLLWPRDLMLVGVAVLTSVVVVLARRLASDQDWLRRASADRRQLRLLKRQARRDGDKPALARCRQMLSTIRLRSMRHEVAPLLVAIVPVALVATWAFSRVAYLPPKAGQPVELRARLAESAVGQPLHLVPQEGLSAQAGWVRTAAPQSHGAVAAWRLSCAPGRHEVTIRCAGRTYSMPLWVGMREYARPLKTFPDAPLESVEVVLEPVKLLGRVGGIDALLLPPWLVAYLLIAVPSVWALKRLLRVY